MSFFSRSKFWVYYLPVILILVIVFGASFVYFGSHKASAAWYATSGTWSYRKSIVIDHTKVGVGTTTPLVNFPVLISVTDPDLKYTSFGGKVASSTALEMVFTSADGSTALNYEIESYASTTGQLLAWVQIPSLSPLSDTVLYMYFGGDATAINTDHSNKTGTWDTNYKGVWHLPDGTTLGLKDSTSNAFNGTNHSATAATGQLDGAASFNGSSQYVSTNYNGLTPGGNQMTISAWVKSPNTTSADQGIAMHIASGGGTYPYKFHVTATGKIQFDAWVTAGSICTATGGTTLSNNTWYYVAATFINTGLGATSGCQVFINSVSDSAAPFGYNFPLDTTTGEMDLGARPVFGGGQDTYFNGTIDEVRISNTQRSADWIATEYKNENSPQTFYTLSGSSLQTRSAGVPLLKSRGGVKFR